MEGCKEREQLSAGASLYNLGVVILHFLCFTTCLICDPVFILIFLYDRLRLICTTHWKYVYSKYFKCYPMKVHNIMYIANVFNIILYYTILFTQINYVFLSLYHIVTWVINTIKSTLHKRINCTQTFYVIRLMMSILYIYIYIHNASRYNDKW